MNLLPLLLLLCWGLVGGWCNDNKGLGYSFWRTIYNNNVVEEGRRQFGGDSAKLEDYPTVAALLDRFFNIRCSGSVIAEYWALTAAHCVTSHVIYVLYNANRPFIQYGSYTQVMFVFRHPSFEVETKDTGQGMDVTLLHHDIGLLRTKHKLKVPLNNPVAAMSQYAPADLINKEITVVGFGQTDITRSGEQLFAAKLQLVNCDRKTWYNCICGIAANQSLRGICSGDSGGPVFYEGVQVGVTSMGAIECASQSRVNEKARSVFTLLNQYAQLINTTMEDTDKVINLRNSKEKFSEVSPDSSETCILPCQMTNIFFIITILTPFYV